MSLSKRLYLGLTLLFTLIFVSMLWINVENTRHCINSQLALQAAETSNLLGLSIKPFVGNANNLTMIHKMIKTTFDTGLYQNISLKDPNGNIIIEKSVAVKPLSVPPWFIDLFPLITPPSVTDIYDGWVKEKTLHISSHTNFGYQQLWTTAMTSTMVIFALFVFAATLVACTLKKITTSLDKLTQQANAIGQGHFIQQHDIATFIEVNHLVTAMNRMSAVLQNKANKLNNKVTKYQKVAYIDPLSQFANRAAFQRRFADLLAPSQEVHCGFLLVIRLSQLDTMNKSFGYIAGDNYLKTAAQIINKLIKNHAHQQTINAYRLTGSDFAVVLDNTDKITTENIASTLIKQFHLASHQVDVVSHVNSFAHIGITTFSSNTSLSHVLIQADHALVAATSNIQGWQFTSDNVKAKQNNLWKKQLEQLLTDQAVYFVAQAIKDKTGKLLYHELYGRFADSNDQNIIPMPQLMAVAERFHLADKFDQLVISKALVHIVSIRCPIALNLSSASLGLPEFAAWLIDILTQYRDICQFVTFEISEQSLSQHPDSVCYLSRKLKSLGCGVTLEHFGATSSSFNHLLTIKPNNIKIDGGYSQNIHYSDDHQLVVQSLVNIAHSLQIKVIAEHVESQQQLGQLQSLFIDNFQGYFIDKPKGWIMPKKFGYTSDQQSQNKPNNKLCCTEFKADFNEKYTASDNAYRQ